MKTKIQHAPTPWAVLTRRFPSPDGYIDNIYLVDKNERTVSFFREANAAFIVRAVNSHEALLAELKNARRILAKHNYAVGSLDLLIAQAEGGRS